MELGTAIVTGGAGTLGLAIGRALLRDGWSVLLVDLADGVAESARQIGAAFHSRSSISTVGDREKVRSGHASGGMTACWCATIGRAPAWQGQRAVALSGEVLQPDFP